MKRLVWNGVRNLAVGGAVILALAPVVTICAIIYVFSPPAHPLGDC